MKNKLMVMTAALAALVVFSASVKATPISGFIGFNGGFSYVGGATFATSSQLNILSAAVDSSVFATGGAFTSASILSFHTPVDINANVNLLLNQQLWSVLVGTYTYTFTVGSITQDINGPGTTLTLAGNGTIGDNKPGDTTTAGAYTMTFGNNGGAFNFGATSANNIPDGGATVLLLGAALSAMGLLRRKLVA